MNNKIVIFQDFKKYTKSMIVWFGTVGFFIPWLIFLIILLITPDVTSGDIFLAIILCTILSIVTTIYGFFVGLLVVFLNKYLIKVKVKNIFQILSTSLFSFVLGIIIVLPITQTNYLGDLLLLVFIGIIFSTTNIIIFLKSTKTSLHVSD